MGGRQKLTIGSWLLLGSMVPFLVEQRYGDWRPAEPPFFIITLFTAGISLWAYFAKRIGWVLAIIRSVMQLIVMGMLLLAFGGHSGTRAQALQLQGLTSLSIAVAALWLLLDKDTRSLVWGARKEGEAGRPGKVRPPSVLRDKRVFLGLLGLGLLLGAIEQRFLYGRISLPEWLLRSVYVLGPWLMAWLFAIWGKDRWPITMLGALVGEQLADNVSVIASNGSFEALITRTMVPLYSLPALLFGLALALSARRSLPVLGIALPIGYAAFRGSSVLLASQGGSIPTSQWLLSAVAGVGIAAVVFLFRDANAESAAASAQVLKEPEKKDSEQKDSKKESNPEKDSKKESVPEKDSAKESEKKDPEAKDSGGKEEAKPAEDVKVAPGSEGSGS